MPLDYCRNLRELANAQRIPGPDAPRPQSGKKKIPGVQMVNLGKGFRGDQVLSCRGQRWAAFTMSRG